VGFRPVFADPINCISVRVCSGLPALTIRVFHAGKDVLREYNRRKRKEAFDWIKNLAVKIVAEMEEGGGKRQASTAWRVAVESWLQRNGIITVSPGKNVTLFADKNGS
jgi:hypothetical protein